MQKRSSKPGELNSLAKAIVDQATGEDQSDEQSAKDPAAVALGRKGGLKGGVERAKRLTPEQRIEAAKKAAQARWGPKKP